MPAARAVDAETPALPATEAASADSTGTPNEVERLSYKFQRLREKLREAIATGELAGRLPGERKLARRFRVNAKTLSKALTDLAAEGILDRSIGRGTFVRGATPAPAPANDRWLIICDADQLNSPVVEHLRQQNPETQISVGPPPQRPSFLNPFKGVILLSACVSDALVRDLIVRNITVVAAECQSCSYSTHSVLIDRAHGAATIAREMLLAGHRRFAVIERKGSELAAAVRLAAGTFAADAVVEPFALADLFSAIEHRMTAILCDTAEAAARVRSQLESRGLQVPRDVSLAVIGSGDPETCPCSGYLVSSRQHSQAIIDILRDGSTKRPITLFLAGQRHDVGTIHAAGDVIVESAALARHSGASA
jgi:hypothetical protein